MRDAVFAISTVLATLTAYFTWPSIWGLPLPVTALWSDNKLPPSLKFEMAARMGFSALAVLLVLIVVIGIANQLKLDQSPMLTTKDIVLVALFAAIIVALGFLPPITIPLIAAVPITAQSMGVMLAGCIIGARRGAAAYVLVILMVAIGLPILSGGRGGLSVLMGPTAGYIVGWVFGAFVTGLIAENMVRDGQPEVRQYVGFFLASIVGGILVVYAFGIAWLCFSTGTPFMKALIGNMAFVPGDLIKAILATLAARAVLAGYPMLPSRA